jgi:hypothetical protein
MIKTKQPFTFKENMMEVWGEKQLEPDSTTGIIKSAARGI